MVWADARRGSAGAAAARRESSGRHAGESIGDDGGLRRGERRGNEPLYCVGVSAIHVGADLTSLTSPALLVRGDDPMHPAEVSELYATTIPECTAMPASTTDIAVSIRSFVDRCLHTAA